MLIEDTIFEKHGEQLNKFLKSSTSVSTLVLKFSNENLKQFIKAAPTTSLWYKSITSPGRR
jgi:hypothetical protein